MGEGTPQRDAPAKHPLRPGPRLGVGWSWSALHRAARRTGARKQLYVGGCMGREGSALPMTHVQPGTAQPSTCLPLCFPAGSAPGALPSGFAGAGTVKTLTKPPELVRSQEHCEHPAEPPQPEDTRHCEWSCLPRQGTHGAFPGTWQGEQRGTQAGLHSITRSVSPARSC